MLVKPSWQKGVFVLLPTFTHGFDLFGGCGVLWGNNDGFNLCTFIQNMLDICANLCYYKGMVKKNIQHNKKTVFAIKHYSTPNKVTFVEL